MATKNFTGAPARADHTAPLPPAAAEALACLELAFLPVPLEIVRAVTRYEVASARFAELSAREASTLSPAEFGALRAARIRMTASETLLAAEGMLHLIEVTA